MKTKEQIIKEIEILKKFDYPFNGLINDEAAEASRAGQVAILEWVIDYEYTGETTTESK